MRHSIVFRPLLCRAHRTIMPGNSLVCDHGLNALRSSSLSYDPIVPDPFVALPSMPLSPTAFQLYSSQHHSARRPPCNCSSNTLESSDWS